MSKTAPSTASRRWDRDVTRRSLIAAAAALPGSAVAAESFPSKPIQFLVPFTPGGGADLLARVVAAEASTRLGQQVVIDNRAGAGGNIAAQAVARARPDGYTLLECNLAHAIAMTMDRRRGYDIVADFAPITQLGAVPFALCTTLAAPMRSVAELVAYAKANPDRLNYASSGIGGPSHLAMELFASLTGTRMTHVPYRGAAPLMSDLIAGRVDLAFLTLPAAQPAVRAGTIRALGVASPTPVSALPDVPAIAAAGVPGFEASTWFGVAAPAGTPPDIVMQLHEAFTAALSVPDVRSRLQTEGFELGGGSPEQFATYIAAETRKWAPVVIAAGAVTE